MNFNRSSLHEKSLKSEYPIVPEIQICDNTINQGASRDNRNDARIMAGLTIFAFIMLQSWRKSRREIKQLKQSKEDLKNSSTQTESQLRFCGSMLKVEQSRTDELTAQLKRTMYNLKHKTSSCKTFAITLSNLRNSQTLLEQELKKRYEEYDDLNEVLAQTKKQLFRSMMEQRNLHLQLCREQRAVHTLENEKKILITEIRELNTEHRNVEENYIKQLNDKHVEIVVAKHLLRKCEAALIDVQKNSSFHERTQKCFINMEHELRLSRLHGTDLQKRPLCSICHRLGEFWTRMIEYPKYTLNCIHVLAYYMLPATPPPTAKLKYS